MSEFDKFLFNLDKFDHNFKEVSLLVPSQFEEKVVRFYCKRSDEDSLDNARKIL